LFKSKIIHFFLFSLSISKLLLESSNRCFKTLETVRKKPAITIVIKVDISTTILVIATSLSKSSVIIKKQNNNNRYERMKQAVKNLLFTKPH